MPSFTLAMTDIADMHFDYGLTDADKDMVRKLCEANDETWLCTHRIIAKPAMDPGSYAYILWSHELLDDGETPAGFVLLKTQEAAEFAISTEPRALPRCDAVELYACVVDRSRRGQGVLTHLLERLFERTDAIGRTVWLIASEHQKPGDPPFAARVEAWKRRGFIYHTTENRRHVSQRSHWGLSGEHVMSRPCPALKCRPRR